MVGASACVPLRSAQPVTVRKGWQRGGGDEGTAVC
jgi:hypothetical protein